MSTIINGEVFDVRLGIPGSGKTILQNEFSAIPALLENLNVYSNYWINWKHDNLKIYSDLEDIVHIRNAVLLIDEIARVSDPRHWESESANVRAFFQLHRHYHVDIHSNTQHISLVPKTALIEVDRFLYVDKAFNGWLTKLLFPNFPFLVFTEEQMTLKEIKHLDSDFIIQSFDDTEFNFDIGSKDMHFFKKQKTKKTKLWLDQFK